MAWFGGVGLMSIRRLAAVHTGLLLAAMFANAASQGDTVRITVLDSVTRASTVDNNNGVPLNCEQLTFDAYCRSTTNVPLISTLLVQEDNQPPFRISCTIDSRYSRCIPLPKGESFDARKEKHGLTVYYVDDKGKERRQLYTLVDMNGKASAPAAAAAVATQPAPAAAAPRQSSPAAAPASSAPTPSASAPSAPAASVGSAQAPALEKAEKVKCSFSSTPAGAEITLDGKYVGSTPSQIELVTGTHAVVFSMPGFAEWKRELTVLSGSELTVSAILQKQQ
jgi:pyruvate/2-oxoglutarate dehydrogenase complex dihydrolipoamide acyltransferase (E2) component